jgi:PhnB protein
MSVQPIPSGYHTATPYLIVNGAARAIEFYKQAFGADEQCRLCAPGGKVGHAEVKIGDSVIMLADEVPEMGYFGPEGPGKSPISLMLYVQDVDVVFQRALAAGATEKRAVQNQFYGDRTGTLVDPFGHVWSIATHVEDVSQEEIQKRFEAMLQH